VRDEDLFVERAVRNASALCDEWILVDHASRDRTPEILRRLARELPRASFHAIRHPRESHELIRYLAGTPTWIFGVDGDRSTIRRGSRTSASGCWGASSTRTG